jgi:hypothetical protein
MNALSLNEKRKLLVRAEKLAHAGKKRNEALKARINFGQKSKNHFAGMRYHPTTPAQLNILRQLGEHHKAVEHHNKSIEILSKKMLRTYPFIDGTTTTPAQLMRKIPESIRQHLIARPVVNQWHFVTGLGRIKRKYPSPRKSPGPSPRKNFTA